MSLLYDQDAVNWYADATLPERMVRQEDIQPGAFTGIGTAIWRGAKSVPIRAALTAHETVERVAKDLGADQDRVFGWNAEGEPLRRWENETRLTPYEIGVVGRVAGSLTKFIGDMALGRAYKLGTFPVPVIQTFADTRREMAEHKVDASDAVTIGELDALNVAIGAGFAMSQATLAGRMFAGATANLAADIPIGKLQQLILENKGHEELAKSRDPLNWERLITTAGLGLLSGIPKPPSLVRDIEYARNIDRSAAKIDAAGPDAALGRRAAMDALRDRGPVNAAYNHPDYDAYARLVEAELNLPPDILVAIKNEGEKSDPTAVSPKKAVGLMQFMADTAGDHGLKVRDGTDERLDPWRSMDAAGDMIDKLLTRFGKESGRTRDDPTLVRAVIAYYNGGHPAARAVLEGKEPPAAETRKYLARVEQHLASGAAVPRPDAQMVDTTGRAEASVPDRGDPSGIEGAAARLADQVPDAPPRPGVDAAMAEPAARPAAISKLETDLVAAYGDDARDLAIAARSKTPDSKLARDVARGMLAVADRAKPISADVVAAARKLLGKATQETDAEGGMLRTNLHAAMGKAKSAGEVERVILAASAKGGGKAGAASRVAKESDTIAAEPRQAELPSDEVRMKAEELADEGQAIVPDGSETSVAAWDALKSADDAVVEAEALARALVQGAMVC